MDTPVPVGIIGATGYTGEVLLQLLLNHPRVRVSFVGSRQHADKPVEDVLPSLRRRSGELFFSGLDGIAEVLEHPDTRPEVVLLALPHGVSAGFVRPLIDRGIKVIDLSADFRLRDPELYARYYGAPHSDPDLLERASYVLPEVVDDGWRTREIVAVPGCYPTSILLPLIPLLRERIIGHEGILISAMSGVTGAGRKASEFYAFSERDENALAYGAPLHRHLSEVEEQLDLAAELPVTVQFIPHLVPMRRGIATTISAPVAPDLEGDPIERLETCWTRYYGDARFVSVLPVGSFPQSAHCVGTNRADLSAVYDARTGRLLLFSTIDNLMKGAAGQAVQILNLWLGFPEADGLL